MFGTAIMTIWVGAVVFSMFDRTWEIPATVQVLAGIFASFIFGLPFLPPKNGGGPLP